MVNRYGFRMLASGIKLDAYNKNPILLYAHQRPNRDNPQITPVGKMHDIRLDENGRLIGDMEFDADDDFAVKLEKKWKKGMLNTVSLKAEVLAVSDEPEFILEGQEYPTVISSLLEEVSIEPIPGDAEAVALRLYHKDDPERMVVLSNDHQDNIESLFPKPKSKTNMKLIQLAFTGQKIVSLAKDATEEQMAEAITNLVEKANESVTLAAQVAQKDTEITTLKKKLEDVELSAKEEKANALVDAAVSAKKITPSEKESFVELAKTNFDAVKKILDAKKGFTSVTDGLQPEGESKYAKLSWDELDRKNLLASVKSEEPETYKNKFKEKFGKEPNI